MDLAELIKEFKITKSQEIYNEILLKLFTKCENITLWLDTTGIENGLSFKTLKDDNNDIFLLAYTKNAFIEEKGEIGTNITVKGIFEIILNNECEGLIIDFDNNKNQFVLLKEYIIRIFKECD